MRLLLTGASGFLGKDLKPRLEAQGHEVIGLSRKGSDLTGDVTLPHLGLSNPPHVDAVYHLAGLLDLGTRRKKEVWNTNVEGMRNVLSFCLEHNVPHLFFCSTAYTQGRNMYELSKRRCEQLTRVFHNVHNLKVTIFKPSVIIADSQNFDHSSDQGIYKFASLAAGVHHRVETIRRYIEGNLRLPVIEPVLRVNGNPDEEINLIPLDTTSTFIANTKDEGTFWVTNPKPPLLKDFISWVGKALLLNMQILPEFKPSVPEVIFQRVASPFIPYLQGASFPSDVDSCPEVDEEFIRETVVRFILGGP